MSNNIEIGQGATQKMYEDALLGFILTDPSKMVEVSEILKTPESFSDPTNRAVYSIFRDLASHDEFPNSPALMVQELYAGGKDGKNRFFSSMDEAARYVNYLLDAPTVNAVKFNPSAYVDYAKQIKWENDRRDLRNVFTEGLARIDKVSYTEKEDYLSDVETDIGKVTMSVHDKSGLQEFKRISGTFREQMELLHSGVGLSGGIKTGIDELDATLNGLKGGEVCVLAARPGSGKSCPRSTPILTWDDTKKMPVMRTMGDLQVGDYVYNRHGKPVQVTGVYPQGKLDAYKMTFGDGRTTICNDEHIWPYWQQTRRKNKPTEVINTMTLREMLDKGIHVIRPSEKNDPSRRNRCRFRIPTNDAVEFPEKDFDLDPYLMGVFLGDGCKNPSGSFILSSQLPEHVEIIAETLGAGGHRRKTEKDYTWMFYKNEYDEKAHSNPQLKIRDIAPQYEELLSNTYCGDKYIPDEYKYGSIEQRWRLIQGLMDTDGSINNNKRGNLTFGTTSKQLAEDFAFIIRSLGINCSIRTNDRRGKKHIGGNGKEYTRKSIEYSVSIRCANEDKPKFFTIKHKKERAVAVSQNEKNRHYDRVELTNVEKLDEKMDMVCIMVDDPEHLYLVDDFLVTHNTTLSMQIAYNVAKKKTVEGKPQAVLIFSLEMMEDQLTSRMIATVGRINMQAFVEEYQHYIKGQYQEYGEKFDEKMHEKLERQYNRAKETLDYVDTLPIFPTTESGLSPNAIRSMVMQMKNKLEHDHMELSLVVIDYLQLMVPNMTKTNASRTEEVGDMSRKMKLLAKDFNVPVLLLAQLNRNADVDTRPGLKDLRESGSIEQDADKVMFIWNEQANKSESDFTEYQTERERREALRKDQMKVTITVAKNRQGETGDCRVIFDKGFQTFLSQSTEYKMNDEQYEQFAEKYYTKTRNTDLFWPLRQGEIPESLEKYRVPTLREADYLKPGGGMLGLMDPMEGTAAKMTLRSKPQPPKQIVVDDFATGFEELGEDDLDQNAAEESTVESESKDNVDETVVDEVENGTAELSVDDAEEDDEDYYDDDDDILMDDLDLLDDVIDGLK